MSGDDVFPDRSMEHRDKIAWMIETDGWAIEPVPADPDAVPPRASYAYTVGVQGSFGFPEIVVFGMTPVAARGLLGEVIGLLRDGVVPPIGDLFVGLFDNELRSALVAVPLPEHGHLFSSAAAWYGSEPFEVVQLVWPDRNGWMPWESGFDARVRYAQPVLGTFDEA